LTHDLRGNSAAGTLVLWKEHFMAKTGTVKFFNADKGYGFIQPEDGSADSFVHITAVQAAGMQTLDRDQRLNYDVERGNNGKESAVNLSNADWSNPPSCPLRREGVFTLPLSRELPPMSQTFDFYYARARESAAEADAATLENVRERALRSEKTWRSLADKAQKTEQDRAKAEIERAERREREREEALLAEHSAWSES
jgi:CspA family cold shock protein